jgi:exo-1,4-beta-D-glucosaminidase
MSDTLSVFTEALDRRYGASTSVEEYSRKAQIQAYEAHRAMMEAYGRNKYTSTGVIQWMLNNAWPSMIWHLYDYYLRPGGGYFGTKTACEPVHVQYSHDDRSVVVVNDTPRGLDGLKVTAHVYDLGLGERFAKEAVVSVAADGVARVLDVPAIPGITTSYFLRLALEDAHGQALSRNFYWLSTRLDQIDWGNSKWYFTPTRVHADLTALEALPQATLRLAAAFEDGGPEGRARVRVENTSPHLAFQVRLKLSDGAAGQEVLPVYWEDNYIELMPGETREIGVAYPIQGRTTRPLLTAEGWNVAPTAP